MRRLKRPWAVRDVRHSALGRARTIGAGTALMLLSPVKRAIRVAGGGDRAAVRRERLSERMISRLERPSTRAPLDVAAGAGVVDHADHDDSPERLIRGAVATA